MTVMRIPPSLPVSVSSSRPRAVDRQWLYPYYAIVFLLIVFFLFGCDSEGGTSFSVTVQVEDAQGNPVQGAAVGVRPCYDRGERWCAAWRKPSAAGGRESRPRRSR